MKDNIRKTIDILETAASSGKMPRPLKTVADFACAVHCVKIIQSGETATTVQSAVAEFFKKQGFRVEALGIGWKIPRKSKRVRGVDYSVPHKRSKINAD